MNLKKKIFQMRLYSFTAGTEKGSLQMELINQWSEAEPMIEGLQKKESFSFQDADYKDENVLEVTFTISNLK